MLSIESGQPRFETESGAEKEKLKKFLEKAAVELQQEGIPVDKNLRINPRAFAGVFPDAVLRADQHLVDDYLHEWQKQNEAKIKTHGEKLEELKTAVFYKNLQSDFVVVRSALYDDIKNKVDNILIDRNTGSFVCAFDEVCDTSSVIYEKKKNKVLELNTKEEGAKLKYGLKLSKEAGQARIVLQSAEHLPIFYLALPPEHLKRALAEVQSSKQQSLFEQKLFKYFMAALDLQIKDLELRSGLHPSLKDNLEKFASALKRFQIR